MKINKNILTAKNTKFFRRVTQSFANNSANSACFLLCKLCGEKDSVYTSHIWLLFISSLLFIQIGFTQPPDTGVISKGFKSLFINNSFDSTLPYTAQLNPNAVSFVQDYMKKNKKELDKMKMWGKSYFNLYDGILRQYNIPVEMKYLSVIESHLQSNLVSWAGAVGPWQLMDYEAKRFGLKVNHNIDERTNYIKSTHVACKLMKELYAEFGDWLLVVAAYNGGAGRVKGAIKKSRSREFWDLQFYLLPETRNHVKKFIATHYLFEGGGGITTLTASEISNEQSLSPKPVMLDSVALTGITTIELKGRYRASVICKHLHIAATEFNNLNQGFEKDLASGKKFNMRIPKNKEQLFYDKKNEILNECINKLLSGE